jgi:hypothetical protein
LCAGIGIADVADGFALVDDNDLAGRFLNTTLAAPDARMVSGLL